MRPVCSLSVAALGATSMGGGAGAWTSKPAAAKSISAVKWLCCVGPFLGLQKGFCSLLP